MGKFSQFANLYKSSAYFSINVNVYLPDLIAGYGNLKFNNTCQNAYYESKLVILESLRNFRKEIIGLILFNIS